MKAILEFNLSCIDEEMSFKRFNKSLDMALFIFEITSNLKKNILHKVDYSKMTNHDVLDFVFEEIGDLLYEYNIIIDDIIT